MRRWLAIAALGAVFLTAPVWAQRRGRMSAGSAGRGGFVARGPAVSSRGAAILSAPRSGVRFGTTVRPPVFFPNRFYHRRFFSGYPFGYYGGYYGYPLYSMYPGFYADYDYTPTVAANPEYNTAASYFDSNAQFQQSEIDRLENEVDRLREERDTRTAAPAGAPQRAEPQPTTMLVFRDQHTEEVGNYAIVGQTLWILSEQKAGKVPLDTLDIPATTKANEDRGVDFRLPE